MAVLNPTGIFNQGYNPDTLVPDSFVGFIIQELPGGAHPLFAMSAYFSKPDRPVVQAEHGYHMEQFVFSSMTVNGAKVAGDTTLTVVSTAGIVPGMTFQVPATREIIRVLTVPGATTVTVARSFGRIAAGAIADAAVLFSVGNAQSEESTRPTARSFRSTYIPNYTSIFRNAWAVSNTAAASAIALNLYNNVARNKEQCAKFHTLDWEYTALFSQPQPPEGTPLVHTTQGVIDSVYQYATGNVFTAGATTSLAQLEAYFEACFAKTNSLSNSNERVALCDAQAFKVVNDIGRAENPAQLWTDAGATSFGVRYKTMLTVHGTVTFVEDKVLNGTDMPTGMMVVVDPSVLRVGYLGGRDTITESMDGIRDSSDQALDAQQGGLLTEMVVMNLVPASCCIINGLTAAAEA